MPKGKDSATALADQLVQALQAQRDRGPQAYPLSFRQLVELADPQAAWELVEKAIRKKPFKEAAIVAIKNYPAAPVALREDLEQLAASPQLLELVLEQRCTPADPVWPIATLKAQVDAKLRPAFEAALTRQVQEGTLPATVGCVVWQNKPQLYLTRIPPPPPPPEVELADQLVRVLESQRQLGEASYPCPLNHLIQLTAPQAAPELVGQALALKPFAQRVLLACKGQPDTPVALAEDVDQLAASLQLLEFVLRLASTPKKWSVPIKKVATKLHSKLKQPFTDAVRRQIEAQALPPTVGCEVVKGAYHLFLVERKPRPAPAVELADALIHKLEALRQEEDAGYPPTLSQLARLLEAAPAASLLHEAVAQKTFQARAALALPKNLESPVALIPDRERLADSPMLLELALTSVRTSDNQAVEPKDLKKKLHKELQQPFLEAVRARLETNQLPPAVGCLVVKKKPLLFLLQDAAHGLSALPIRGAAPSPNGPGQPAAVQPVVMPALDFAQAFEDAFERLDRQKGSHNFVSLVDLRRAIPCDRASFDAGLHQLRAARRYTMSAAEGRSGISPEEQQAGVLEEGALLLFVSRKQS